MLLNYFIILSIQHIHICWIIFTYLKLSSISLRNEFYWMPTMCWGFFIYYHMNSWTARRSNQSILGEISPGCSLEGLMLMLKLQYFGYLMLKVDSLEKTLMRGRIGREGEGDGRGLDGWMASLTWWTWVWVDSGSWWWTGRLGVLRFMGSQRVGHDWATELNWSV